MQTFRLERAILFVKNMDVMAGFYREVLGLVPTPGSTPSSDWQLLSSGPAELAPHRIPPHHARDIVIDEPPRARSGAATKLVFAVDDLEAVRGLLIDRGVVELPRPELNPPGRLLRCDFMDPEGNVFQISAD